MTRLTTDMFALARSALISPCGLYRYELWRQLNQTGVGTCCFVMLNPSTADADIDDNTIRRCQTFAHQWGYQWLAVVNMFAYRATDPSELDHAADPIGRDNNAHILKVIGEADIVICAWGKSGRLAQREQSVLAMLKAHDLHHKLHTLSLNKDGTPKHPLYERGDAVPRIWSPYA